MLKIRIERHQGDAIPFVAVNDVTGEVVFRNDDPHALEAVCRKLGWDVVAHLTAHRKFNSEVRARVAIVRPQVCW
jgi:hypothetical protein